MKTLKKALTQATLGDSDSVQRGDWVLAAGNPFGMLEQSVTAGIISAKGRRGLGLNAYEDFLQTDAAINRGNSGGPLVNIDGKVIGVNTAIYSKSGGYQGIGFAIPINQANKIAEKLIKDRQVIRGWMGIVLKKLAAEEAKQAGIKEDEGLLVDGVYRHGPAHQAGIRPGDVVLRFNGKPVLDGQDISHRVADMEPGKAVTLSVKRYRKTKDVEVILGRQPRLVTSKSRVAHRLMWALPTEPLSTKRWSPSKRFPVSLSVRMRVPLLWISISRNSLTIRPPGWAMSFRSGPGSRSFS